MSFPWTKEPIVVGSLLGQGQTLFPLGTRFFYCGAGRTESLLNKLFFHRFLQQKFPTRTYQLAIPLLRRK